MAIRIRPVLLQSVIGLMTLAMLLISPIAGAKESKGNNRLPVEDVQRFSTAISQIKHYYVKKVDDKELFEDAIRGMLSGLDPHSGYLDEKDFRELTESTRGEFGGLGIEVTMDNGLIKVISPIDDTPAARAGLKSGDYIVRIDDKPVRDMTLRDAVNMMRGKRGSSVKIIVIRKGESKPLTFSIVRDVIRIKTVRGRIIDKHYAYVRVSHFQAPTVKDLRKLLNKLQKKSKGPIAGMVLDLRNNPGGLLDAAIEMSDLFIHNDSKGKEELIVYTKGRIAGSKFRAVANKGDMLKNAPIIVLINGGSASGSEIVAGALQDNKRAIVIGTKSFGKGSVQTVLPLGKKRGIKITTALYYTPAGRSIQAKGIVPDIVVEDIKVPNKKDKGTNILNISEADLEGHLANGNNKNSKKANAKKTKKDKKSKDDDSSSVGLIYKDYQLYQALNILKGITVFEKT